MVFDRIQIKKALIPYTFNIALPDELYEVTVNYNKKHDLFTVGLAKNGNILCVGEPIIYGFPLFGDLYRAGEFPPIEIIPYSTNGEEPYITFENLGETHFLLIDNV